MAIAEFCYTPENQFKIFSLFLVLSVIFYIF